MITTRCAERLHLHCPGFTVTGAKERSEGELPGANCDCVCHVAEQNRAAVDDELAEARS